MKSYKKILAIAIIATLAFTVVPSLVTADPDVVPLIAGQHYTAGEVRVSNDAVNIYVEYETSGGWYITGTHLYVGKTNPNTLTTAPGQFPYSEPDEETETYHKYIIPLPDIDGYHLKLTKKGKSTGKLEANGNPGVGVDDTVYIAAHAGVCKDILISGGLSEIEEGLPEDPVNVLSSHSYETGDSYFDIIISGDGDLNGEYDGWCIDVDHIMNPDPYLANVYSSYDHPYLEFLDYPDNLDLVNYIINQEYVGNPSGCDGDYTVGDVQLAIWELVDDEVADARDYFIDNEIEYNDCRVDEIIDDAEANDGFVPGCGELLAIILEPTSIDEVYNYGQLAIIGIPIPCEYKTKCETAWGQGTDFDQSNWAMYFTYTIT